MDVSYLAQKADSIKQDLTETVSEIKRCQDYIDELSKKNIYLQGSLALVSELIDYYTNLEGGDNEEG